MLAQLYTKRISGTPRAVSNSETKAGLGDDPKETSWGLGMLHILDLLIVQAGEKVFPLLIHCVPVVQIHGRAQKTPWRRLRAHVNSIFLLI